MDNDELISEYLEESLLYANQFEKKLLNFEKESQKLLIIQDLFRDMHTLKANTGTLGFTNFESTLHKSEDIFNSLQKQDNDGIQKQLDEHKMLDLFFDLSDFIKHTLQHIKNNKQDLEQVNQTLNSRIDETQEKVSTEANQTKSSKKQEPKKKNLKSIQLKALEMLRKSKEVKEGSDATINYDLDDNIIIKLKTLNHLSTLGSELILARNQLGSLIEEQEDQISNEFLAKYHKIDNLVQQLTERITKVRMQPLSIITDKLRRSIRELAKDFNKEVNFETEGENIEIDRSILESLKDSLIHLFRNAMDHGLETPEQREEFGKSTTGNISLKAHYSGNNIILEVSDDGRGIAIDKVKSKALEKGLISELDLETMPQEEIFNLIFHPSFSTKEEVSKISGRGVGMNIVLESIKKNNGSIEIQSKESQGTTFTIKLPLTLALGSAVIVSVNGVKYAIPDNFVKELINIDSKLIQGKKKVEIREDFFEIIHAKDFLDKTLTQEEVVDENQKEFESIIIQTDDKPYLLIIDSIIDLQDIVVKSLPKGSSDLDYCLGTTILPEGEVALILDMDKAYKNSHKSKRLRKATAFQTKKTEHNNKVISFRLGSYLFGLNRELVQETVFKKSVTPLPLEPNKGLMNLRDNIILSKKLAPILNIDSAKVNSELNIVLEIDKEKFAIEVDEIDDFIEIDEEEEKLKDLNSKLKNFTIEAYKLKDGNPIYIIDENVLI